MENSSYSNSSDGIFCFFNVCWAVAPVPQAIYVAALVGNILLFVPLNTWVVWMGAKQAMSKGQMASSEILTLNQAVMELINCVCFVLLLVMNVVCNAMLNAFGGFLACFSFSGRTLFYGAICVERYLAVVHPVTYLSRRMDKHRKLSAGMIWVASVGCASLGYFRSVPYPVYLMPFCLTIGVMVFCSLAMLKALIKPKPGDVNNEAMDQNKRKAFRVITVILLFTVFSYVPYLSIWMINLPIDIFCLGFSVGFCLFFPSFLLQPLLYLSKVGKFNWLKCF